MLPLAKVLAETCTKGQNRIWPFIVPAAHKELGFLILRLVQVLAQTCTRGQLRIKAFIVPLTLNALQYTNIFLANLIMFDKNDDSAPKNIENP